jgi:hypothetical protein
MNYFKGRGQLLSSHQCLRSCSNRTSNISLLSNPSRSTPGRKAIKLLAGYISIVEGRYTIKGSEAFQAENKAKNTALCQKAATFLKTVPYQPPNPFRPCKVRCTTVPFA